MFTWDADKIRFLMDASEYNRFHGELARRAAAYLGKGAHVCDAGCGLGYLSLALSPYCARVTAADISKEALDVLRKNIEKTGAANILPWEGDVFCLPPDMQFDAMIFCFFGSVHETLRCAKAHCSGKVVLFKRNWQAHRFSIADTPLERFTFAASCAELDRLKVPYESAAFQLEMGQPFCSLKDAAAFFRLHSHGNTPEPIGESDIESRLVRTDSPEFPYYLPSTNSVGMIVLDAGEIPEPIEMIKNLEEIQP